MIFPSIEPWIIPTAGAFLCSGSVAFISKVTAERKFDSALSNVYIFLGQWIFSLIAFYFLGAHILNINITLFAIIGAIFVYWNYKSRADALANMDSAVFFMNYRIISSILLGIAGVWLFHENITTSNIFGVFLGFLVFFFLLESTSQSKKFLRKGIPYLLISILCIVGLNVNVKNLIYSGSNIYDYLFLLSTVGFLLSVGINWKKIRSAHILHNPDNIIGMGFIQGALLIILTSLTAHAFATGGDMVIVYKVISYSLFIPIILSILIYKEPITPRKLIAAAIMIISLYFLV